MSSHAICHPNKKKEKKKTPSHMGVCRMIPHFGRQSDKWRGLSEGADHAHYSSKGIFQSEGPRPHGHTGSPCENTASPALWSTPIVSSRMHKSNLFLGCLFLLLCPNPSLCRFVDCNFYFFSWNHSASAWRTFPSNLWPHNNSFLSAKLMPLS